MHRHVNTKNMFSSIKNLIWIVFRNNPSPPNWNYTAWDLDPNNNDTNNGYENEDFIVWMRTAAMPTFRKLYRKLVSTNSSTFQNGLPRGNYVLTINYSKCLLHEEFFILFWFLKIIRWQVLLEENNLLSVQHHGWEEKIHFLVGLILLLALFV